MGRGLTAVVLFWYDPCGSQNDEEGVEKECQMVSRTAHITQAFKSMNTQRSIIDTCYRLSIKGLLQNSTELGLLAASPKSLEGKKKNYTSLFSRDIGVCSLGILSSEDKRLLPALEASLETLANRSQSRLGALPFHYQPDEGLIQWWMPGSIDSTLWWCIAFLLHFKHTKNKTFFEKYKQNLEKAFTWLTYQDTNNDYLIEQGESSDWADEMPRMGAVLYSNALWY